ncbi:MAG TPA: AMP-binding protein, partial [Burkholderiaceae bacterium]|nr:AMP-binding protein [Burkholderiaceae bacterium]
MSYDALYRDFRWKVPADFNWAEACCARWARETPDAIAIHYEHENGTTAMLTFGELQRDANRLSNALRQLGIARGERVAIVMPQ